mmetsp:Transcript_67157/g.160829  ORF Transcript_67157/g.160829 Transcript_67157/m.160829 type:complete len:305 (-) Transcript_67157:111-1025(-)
MTSCSSKRAAPTVIDLSSDTEESGAPERGLDKRRRPAAATARGDTSKRHKEEALSAARPGLAFNTSAVTCLICFEDAAAWTALQLECSHGWFCATCIRRHVEARIELGDPAVSCPSCTCLLSHAALRTAVPTALYERLLAGSLESAVGASPDLWACPTPDCINRVALAPGEEPRLNCSHCGQEHCLRCHANPYHTGMTCEEHAAQQQAPSCSSAEVQLEKWLQETGTRRCPSCKSGVTKEDLSLQETQQAECHKMVCRVCRTRFCFNCLSVLTCTWTCGCTGDNHGFIDPHSGKFMQHLRGPRR